MLIVKLTPTVTDISVTARAAVNGGANALEPCEYVYGDGD